MIGASLVAENISWGPSPQKMLVYPTSFSVPAGRVMAVVGANGAGKTTLLRLLYRYLRPLSGRILIDGEDIWQMHGRRAARTVAAVLQEQPTDFSLTVEEIVALGRTPHKTGFAANGSRDRQIVDEALTKLHLDHFAPRKFGTLSGGERQRVMVARALAQEPRILILDEPTNHLDIRHQLEVLSLIRDLKLTVITSLHDLNLASEHADDVLLLADGHTLACGPFKSVLTEPLISKAFDVTTQVQKLHPSGQQHLTFHI